MKNRRIFLALLAFSSLSLSGCSMAPSYTRPDFAVPSDMTSQGVEEEKGVSVAPKEISAELALSDFFQSEVLKSIVERSLENNRDLRAALSRTEQARAIYRIERSDRLPNVDAQVSANKQRFSDNGSLTGNSYTTATYSANLVSTAFELDLFGRVKSLTKAALEDYLATEEAAQSVRIALVAEVANTYLQYLADKESFLIAKDAHASQKATYELILARFENGISSQLELSQAKVSLSETTSNLAYTERLMAQSYNALTLLVGASVDDLLDEDELLEDVMVAETLPQDLSSTILLKRPDVMQAEHTLQSMNASIGAARAAFFPNISLTGGFGFMSRDLSELFSGGSSGAWSFTPTVTLPIFAYGRNLANLGLSKAKKEEAVNLYEKSIQTAFKEVRDELIAHRTLQEQYEAQQVKMKASSQVYSLTYARYEEGIDSFLNVLDSQRALYLAQTSAVDIQKQKIANLVNFYKVVGGGQF